ncbi:MAG: hypothetical protein MI923_14065 [Phycisphaerales bacterium]|nr:hypothetical protein [Phycisphaerales bacterium]
MDLSFFPPPPSEHAAKSGWLDQVAEATQAQYRSVSTRSAVLAWTRFLTFAAMPVGAYFYMTYEASWGPILVGLGLILFVLSVRVHKRVQARARTLRFLQDVIAESQRRLSGEVLIIRSGEQPTETEQWQAVLQQLDGDGEFQKLSAQEIGDLDLFGEPLSLYGLLNRTSSPIGATRLAHVLTHPSTSMQAIHHRQTAVQWLANNPAARFLVTAAAAGMRPLQKQCGHLHQTIRDATPMPNRGALSMLRLWGVVGPITLVLGIANQLGWTQIHIGWWPLVAVVMINAILIQLFLKPMREHIRPWLDLDDVVAALKFFCETSVEHLPDEGVLGKQKQRLHAALGHGCLPALQRRIPLLFLGLSGFMHTIIDVLVFWDLQVLWLMEKCYIHHRTQLLDAIAALGECEMFTSLGAFAWEQPDACQPEFVPGPWHLEIVNGRHPLIPPEEAVTNTLELNDNVRTWIITGSNMSGKSTFLRMTATNVLLAQIGSAATTTRIKLSPLEIMTDLRIRDDLSRKESYFLAEVRQVRRMIEAAQSDRPVIALIDEPFRGTNSAERVAAASAVITALMEGSGLHLIATHDAALTSLGDTGHAENHHFAEAFSQEQLVFDYRLHSGPAQSRNALRVLEAERYPKALVDHAKSLLPKLREDSLETS